MTDVLLIMTNGRKDYLQRTLASYGQMVWHRPHHVVVHNDCPDPAFEQWLNESAEFEEAAVVYHSGGGLGFGGAIRSAWNLLRMLDEHLHFEHVFHLEEDFTFNRPVSLIDLRRILELRPNVQQVALLRQPWNRHEELAGGIIQQHPEAYEQHSAPQDGWPQDLQWVEHQLFFTTNPSLYRMQLVRETDWPEGPESEGHFGHNLRRDGVGGIPGDEIRFAFFGHRSSPPLVTHIGHERTGSGY